MSGSVVALTCKADLTAFWAWPAADRGGALPLGTPPAKDTADHSQYLAMTVVHEGPLPPGGGGGSRYPRQHELGAGARGIAWVDLVSSSSMPSRGSHLPASVVWATSYLPPALCSTCSRGNEHPCKLAGGGAVVL